MSSKKRTYATDLTAELPWEDDPTGVAEELGWRSGKPAIELGKKLGCPVGQFKTPKGAPKAPKAKAPKVPKAPKAASREMLTALGRHPGYVNADGEAVKGHSKPEFTLVPIEGREQSKGYQGAHVRAHNACKARLDNEGDANVSPADVVDTYVPVVNSFGWALVTVS